MIDLLRPPPAFLSSRVLALDLIELFMVYVTLAFVASLVLRWRFYLSIYRVSTLVARECPNVFKLLDRHLPMLMQNGVVPMLVAYAAVFGLYFLYTRVFFPGCTLTIADFDRTPAALVGVAALYGAMIAVDAVLILDIGRIDEPTVAADLRLSEYWLGSRLTRGLDVLGRWNPIRVYADYQTRLVLRDFNRMFHYSLAWVLVQSALRAVLVVAMFAVYAWQRGVPPPALLQ
jgi:hypothetical protein